MTKSKTITILTILVPILIILTFLTYYKRFPTGDDAWFAEESYWLLRDGVIRSEFFRGLLGWENQLFVSHKLFLGFGSIMMWLGGNSLYILKLTSLLFLGLLVFLFKKYIAYRNLEGSSMYLVLFLLFSNTLIIKMSFEYRPEVMMMTLGFASYLLIQYQHKYLIALGGILAGMALLCHLNGVIYIFAGFFMLLLSEKKWNALLFGSFAVITSMFYFYDIWQANGFDIWLYQFRNDPATQNAFGIVDKLKVMLSFPTIFFKSPQEMSISILLIAFCWTFKNRIKQLPRNLTIYTIALVVSFWLITKRASGLYEMLFIPTMMTLIIELFSYVDDKSTFKLSKPLLFAFFLYLVIGVVGIGQLIYKINTKPYMPEKYSSLSKYFDNKSVGLVPLQFFFNEYEYHKQLLCFENFDFQLAQAKLKATPALLAEWAIKNKVEFIVFDYKNNKANFFPKPKENLKGYKISYTDDDVSVYVRD
ncbi:hypothetical protein VB264_00365 [Arcicella aquatica]|uniref:Glycosyltransferase RgtA/B/C/D-like domain-containing protein n=1 Tax=Arcicella aquatica TaxID=217141 RepID=A0ABU5QGP0_9BACT|nr:hypothetical protein [Arcicella aquatica]MEA5256216.1 hypothetical protein [Arcicella aquatica]